MQTTSKNGPVPTVQLAATSTNYVYTVSGISPVKVMVKSGLSLISNFQFLVLMAQY